MSKKEKNKVEVIPADRIPALQQDAQEAVQMDLWSYPVEDMTLEEVHVGWSILDLLEKTSKKRKDTMRERLLAEAEEEGKEDDRGSFILEVGDGEVKKEKRQGKDVVKEGAVRGLLAKKGIKPEVVFREVVSYEFDPAAFKRLLDEGIITAKEARSLSTPGKVTWALKVKKPGFLPKALKGGT